MNLLARIGREIRYLSGLARTLWRVREIAADSDVLICDDFETAVDKFADHTALIFEGQTYTYRRLETFANRFAAWAEVQGLQRGDTVALLLPNRAEYVPAWMGLAKRGVAAALINNNLTGAALAHCLTISGAQHVITDESCIDTFAALSLSKPMQAWSIDPNPTHANVKTLDLRTPKLPPERPPRALRTGLTASDVALYIFTSGTTGMPKAAKITHMRAQLYMRAFAGVVNAKAHDRLYNVLPLYHSTGGLCGVGAALLNGATLVLRRKFSATHFWDDVAEYGCTVFVYIGELCRYLTNQPPHPNDTPNKLRVAFGNGMRPDVWDEFQKRFDVEHIIEFYGSTEGNVSMFNFDGQSGAIGRVPGYLRNNFNVRIVQFDVDSEMPIRTEDGLCRECAPGDIGEAIGLIKNDARHNYAGYADKAASERKVLHDVFEHGDSWFRTGDLMRQDKDGYFYFVDRIGDTFRWKGENVSTTEVAEMISHYPGIAEINVYGVKIDKLDGRAGMAAITPEGHFNLDGLRDFIARNVPSYARPLFVRLQPAIETTGTFKYRKVDLVRDGFDPARISQPLYFDDPETQTYAPITPELYKKIQSGAYKL